MKKVAIVFICLLAGTVLFDYATAQYPVQSALNADIRNRGIDVWVHRRPFEWSTLVVDIRAVTSDKAPIEVMRALFQISEALNEAHYETVILASDGHDKFVLNGTYFRQVGLTYGTENPVYLIRTLPEHVYRIDGRQAYGTWTGGILGVLAKQMDDVNDFNKRWYGDVVK